MKKSSITTLLSISAVIILTGCSVKDGVSNYRPVDTKTAEITTAVTGADGFTMLNSTLKNRAAFRVLQVTAETAKKHGDKYFAIVEPASISNEHGNMMNTAEEYIKECGDYNFVEGVVLATHCEGLVNSANWGRLKVISFKEKPTNLLTYDVEAVLSVVKMNSFYKALNIAE
ncbi:MAG: hypothetical protein PHE67_05795 [Campylobacterales bacterium]|nr:hypothetical protein [Campylobacterales bacterium]